MAKCEFCKDNESDGTYDACEQHLERLQSWAVFNGKDGLTIFATPGPYELCERCFDAFDAFDIQRKARRQPVNA